MSPETLLQRSNPATVVLLFRDQNLGLAGEAGIMRRESGRREVRYSHEGL